MGFVEVAEQVGNEGIAGEFGELGRGQEELAGLEYVGLEGAEVGRFALAGKADLRSFHAVLHQPEVDFDSPELRQFLQCLRHEANQLILHNYQIIRRQKIPQPNLIPNNQQLLYYPGLHQNGKHPFERLGIQTCP